MERRLAYPIFCFSFVVCTGLGAALSIPVCDNISHYSDKRLICGCVVVFVNSSIPVIIFIIYTLKQWHHQKRRQHCNNSEPTRPDSTKMHTSYDNPNANDEDDDTEEGKSFAVHGPDGKIFFLSGQKMIGKADKCAICQQEYIGETEKSRLMCINKCKHIFHEDCLIRWIGSAPQQILTLTCPLCRVTIENLYSNLTPLKLVYISNANGPKDTVMADRAPEHDPAPTASDCGVENIPCNIANVNSDMVQMATNIENINRDLDNGAPCVADDPR